MPISRTERILAAREGGHVRRCHGIPHTSAYTVANHSFYALTLLFLLYPTTPPMALVKALLFHDCGERWVGDVPAPAKWFNPALGEAYHHAEETALAFWGFPSAQGLSPEAQRWLVVLDRLELWLWCHDELHAGNDHVQPMLTTLNQWFDQGRAAGVIPQPCCDFLDEFVWERLSLQTLMERLGQTPATIPEIAALTATVRP